MQRGEARQYTPLLRSGRGGERCTHRNLCRHATLVIERLRVMVRPFVEGDLVKVIERQSPGVNKAGGVARVSRLNEDGTLAVSYVLGNGKESSVEVKVSSPSTLLLLLRPLRLPLLLLLLLGLAPCCAAAVAVEIDVSPRIVGCVSLQNVESDFDFCFFSSLEPRAHSKGSRVAAKQKSRQNRKEGQRFASCPSPAISIMARGFEVLALKHAASALVGTSPGSMQALALPIKQPTYLCVREI